MFSLKNFFSKKNSPQASPLSDYSSFVTDIHSHLIPGIDDGCKTIEESISMIRSLSALGFKKIITTPHIMSDSFKNTPAIIHEGLRKLRERVESEKINILLEAAAEYYLDEEFENHLHHKDFLSLKGNLVLFEVSYMNAPENLMRTIFELNVNGYKPLLAHPERYPFWFSRFEEYGRLKDAGVLFQLNINSLVGYYGKAVKRTAQQLIDANMIDFIGSDLHGERHLQALQISIHAPYLWKLAAKGVGNSKL